MNKKGESHIDWIISMSLFILYIMTILIFFKPGVYQQDTSTILMDVLEESFREEAEISVYRTPLIIDGTQFVDGSGVKEIQINFPIEGIISNFALVADGSTNLEPMSIVTVPSKKINFEVSIDGNGDNLFWLIYYPGYDYTEDEQHSFASCGADCIVNPVHEWGSREEIVALSRKNLDYIFERDYEGLRGYWDFPETNEFSVSEVDVPANVINGEIPAGVDVISRDVIKSVIDERLNREITTINLKVW